MGQFNIYYDGGLMLGFIWGVAVTLTIVGFWQPVMEMFK
jgi:hypothetical protein